jgi:hypothetical protein
VEGLRRAIEDLPAGERSLASAIEAAIVLSRSARVVESYVAALAPPDTGEVVMTVREEDADKLIRSLEGWRTVAQHAVGPTLVLRVRQP